MDVQTQRLFVETGDKRHLLALPTERGSEVVQVSSQCSQVEVGRGRSGETSGATVLRQTSVDQELSPSEVSREGRELGARNRCVEIDVGAQVLGMPFG